jgi:hypothetical protein
MIDKAGLLELELSRQAGAQLLSLRKKCAIEVVDDEPDEFGALLQKWKQRLTLETINIRQAYGDGKINIVLAVVAPDGKDYRLVIRRAPNWKIECNGSGGASLEKTWAFMSGGVAHWNKGMMYLLPAEFVQGPDSRVLPSFVWLQATDSAPRSDGQFLYFSLYAGAFKFIPAPSNWELDAFEVCAPVQDRELADEIIENALQVLDDVAGKPLDFGRCAGVESNFYELFASLQLTLFDDHIGLGLAENSNGIFKLADVAFGPFNL